MSERSPANAAKIGSGSAFAMLQRKCACGGKASQVSGDCSDCQRKKTLGIQKKVAVGTTDDPLEHEADRAAERVLSMPASAAAPHAHALTPVHSYPPSESAPAPVAQAASPAALAASGQPAATTGEPQSQAPSEAELDHGGSPLEPGLRGFFEQRYERDLSEVRIHVGGQAESWNDRLTAHAFTYGSHIWLGRGQRPRADFLLAHELAHVIQQRQPQVLRSPKLNEDIDGKPSLSESGRIVRRLPHDIPFWAPLGAENRKRGSDQHSDLLGLAQAANTDLDLEAPASNGNRDGVGPGKQGRIDLYQGKGPTGGHARVGMFFDGPKGAGLGASAAALTPKKHPAATLKDLATGNFNPSVNDAGGIEGIRNGPTDVQIGELKPASRAMLDAGEEQIGHYRDGFLEAQRLTNEWAKDRGFTDMWNLNRPKPLADGAVKFNRNNRDLKFNPSAMRDDENLVLGTISFDHKFKLEFSPALHGLPPIKGGQYAQAFGSGKGLWMYFSRPKNLDDALAAARSVPEKHGTAKEMVIANLLQDDVIAPLFKPPVKKEVATLLRNRSAAAPIIRRVPKKTPKLSDDDFKFTVWKDKHTALHDQIWPPKASQDNNTKLAKLELLQRAYQAEEALDPVLPGMPKLPPKSTDQIEIAVGKGKDRKVVGHRNLADMASWLKGWTSKPAEILGVFRDKFGDSFVFVANKLITLRDRIREKYRKAFESHPSKPGGSRGKIIAKALLKALLQIAKVQIPHAVHLFMDALVAGTRKKLAKVFDIDPEKMLEDTFGGEFKEWNTKLTGLKNDAETYVDNVVDTYSKELGWIKDVMDASKIIGPILDAASIMIQCGKKPGWNCLLLLSKQFRECGMEAALNICEVQKQIAGIVSVVGPLRDMPATLAQTALDLAKDASPDGLKDIFSEKVPTSGAFNNDEIECEDSQSELTCPGFIPLGGSGKGGLQDEDSKQKDEGQKSETDKGQEAEQGEPKKQAPHADKEGPGADDQPGDKPGAKEGKGPPEKGGEPKREQQAPEGGDQPGQGPSSGDKPGGSGGDKPGGSSGPPPQSGGGQQPQGQQQGGGGGGAGGGQMPKPDEVHKALNDLLNEQGPEGMAALANLAEQAGMPGDAPLSAEQVRKIQDLLKKTQLSREDLQRLAHGGGSTGGKGKPLERFLDTEARGEVMKQTLEKLRKKQYEFKFREMAKLKVHWKVMVPYKPGPFRNAPALMWDDTIRAAGVVDGEFGKCRDGGKVELTITRADMREEGTEKKLTIHVPFRDNSAQIAGNVCPTSPPPPPKGKREEPKGGQGPKGQGGGGQGQGEQEQGEGGGDKQQGSGGSGSGTGKKGGTPEQDKGGTPEKGEGTPETKPGGEQQPGSGTEAPPGSEIDSSRNPRKPPDANKDKGKDDKGTDEPDKEQRDVPGSTMLKLDIGALGASCGLKCPSDELRFDIEEVGELETGWQVLPEKSWADGTQSLINPPNKKAPFTLRNAAQGSTEQEVVLTCEGKTCVIGRVRPSSARPGMHELVSGSLLDSLRALVRQFLQENKRRTTGRAERIHFF